MTLYDQLTAPGRELEVLVRAASRGQRAAQRLVLRTLPRLLDHEERWLLPELAQTLDAHREAHERIRALVEQLVRTRAAAVEARPLWRALDAMLGRHLRDERSQLLIETQRTALAASPRVERFLRGCRAAATAGDRDVRMG